MNPGHLHTTQILGSLYYLTCLHSSYYQLDMDASKSKVAQYLFQWWWYHFYLFALGLYLALIRTSSWLCSGANPISSYRIRLIRLNQDWLCIRQRLYLLLSHLWKFFVLGFFVVVVLGPFDSIQGFICEYCVCGVCAKFILLWNWTNVNVKQRQKFQVWL